MRPLTRLAVALLLALSGGLAACGDDAEPDASQDDRDGQDQPGDDGDDGSDPDETDDPDDPDDDDDNDDEPEEVVLPPEAQPYVDALATTFATDPGTPMPADAARCASTRIVGIVGMERIEAAGITPEQFADDADLGPLGLDLDDGFAAYDSFAECDIDWRALVIDSFAADADDPEAVRACLEDALDEDELRELMARAFILGDEAEESPQAEEFFDSLFACTLPGEG